MTITAITKGLAVPLLAATLLVGCGGGAENGHDDHGGSHEHDSAANQTVVPASEVVDMQEAGTGESELVEWVNDTSRTFDLSDDDVGDLMGAGVPDPVVNAMMARSEEYQAAQKKKNGPGDGHSHSHDE